MEEDEEDDSRSRGDDEAELDEDEDKVELDEAGNGVLMTSEWSIAAEASQRAPGLKRSVETGAAWRRP